MTPRLEEDDVEALRHAAKIQMATKRALERIQNQVTDTELVGCTTLGELEKQREQLDRIMVEGDRLEVSLDTTEKLLNRFNMASLRFSNAGAAKRLVKKETKFRKGLEDKAKERAAEISQEIESADIETSAPIITKHSQKREKSVRKKTEKSLGASSGTKTDRKSLFFGTASISPIEEVKQLEDGDAEIEQQLDSLDLQIDELVRMSNEMSSSIQQQDKGLQQVNKQLERATTKQQVANHRTRWFLSGKKRESYERQDFFDRHSLVRKLIS